MANKPTKIIILAAILFLMTAGISVSRENNKMNIPQTLVVYFSHSGNTKRIADKIALAVNADTVRIETVIPYSGTPDEISNQGKKEVHSAYKPEIKPLNVNLSDYKRIVIGTPTWWYTMAPAVLTFFSQTDLSGKDVVLYMTNAGWPGHTIKDMQKAAGRANIISTKEILFDSGGGNQMITSEKEIDAWIASWK